MSAYFTYVAVVTFPITKVVRVEAEPMHDVAEITRDPNNWVDYVGPEPNLPGAVEVLEVEVMNSEAGWRLVGRER